MGALRSSYLDLPRGELRRRGELLLEMMCSCSLCPRNCRVNRLKGELGACGVASEAVVSSFGSHFGEESVLVGRYGSGTIFMTGCNLACVFCQNYDISQLRRGHAVSGQRLADMMIELQEAGCHNINFVTPTHQIARIVESLALAVEGGLSVPVVYNCGGYESIESLRLLEGIVDIYMPDAKYGSNASGEAYSGVPDYWDRSREALREMHRQVGDLDIRRVACPEGGTATVALRGMLVRHLVLPGGIARTEEVMRFLAEEISGETFVNVMAQYRPEYHACRYPELGGQIGVDDYRAALTAARKVGLHRFSD